MTGSLNQNRRNYALFFVMMILVVYLGHGIFHPVAVQSFKLVFGEVTSSQTGEPLKKHGAPLS